MKQLVVLSATFAVAQIFAAEIFVGAKEEKALEVAADTVVVTTHGKLVKEGEGALTLETGALAQDWEASLGVKEGALKLKETVAEGAKLRLDYTGIGEVDRIKLGGIAVSGYVSAETHPQFISGDGVLYARPKPTVMIIR
jgi:hypothetical protein